MIKKIFRQNLCPFCSTKITKENRSREHIFPDWLLKECSLYDRKLTLTNGTAIPYRKVLIPCCKKCNNNLGSMLENNIQNLFKKDTKLSKNDEYLLVVWFTKIYLGLRYLEQRLPFDRATKSKKSILPRNFLDDQNQVMFSLMRNFGKKNETQGLPPWSIFRYKISKREKEKFWYYDPINHPLISILINQIGFVCLLTDGGGQGVVLSEAYKQDKRKRFNLQAFIELTIRHFYKELLRDYIPHFLTIENEKIFNIVNLNNFFIYKEWEHKEYTKTKENILYFFNKHLLD